MCNRLSPEKAVIWGVIHSRHVHDQLAPRLTADHFTHRTYRRCFRICARIYAAGGQVTPQTLAATAAELGYDFTAADRRAIDRMLRQPPQSRMVTHAQTLAQAMIDLQAHGCANMERLVN
ncbi:hypothetical protein JCM17960_00600 [Magnetospira thiophila]